MTKVALVVLLIAATATLTYFLPTVSFFVGCGLSITHQIIASKNTSEINKQRKFGFDNQLLLQAVKSIKKTISIKKMCYAYNFVSITALFVFFPYQIPFTMIYGGVNLFFWIKDHNDWKNLLKKMDSNVEVIKLQEEYEKLHSLYPKLTVSESRCLCENERKKRGEKKRYFKRLKQSISSGWEEMLRSKKFTIKQGIELDSDIFVPLSQMSVFYELKKKITLNELNCPPSLKSRLIKLKDSMNIFSKLSKKEKNQIKNKILGVNGGANRIFRLIGDLGTGLLTHQKLFKTTLLKGSERYAMKKFKIIDLFKLQKIKLKNYREQLFFTSSPHPDELRII